MNENENFSWKMLMKTASDDQPTMRTPALVGIVVTLHVLAVGAFLFIQGCGTVQPGVQPGARALDADPASRGTAAVEPPPPPVMPPRGAPAPRVDMPRPGLRPPAPAEPVRPLGESVTHTVQRGDTLSKIASQHGVTTRELTAFNNISDPNSLRVGQKVLVPTSAAAPRPAAPAPAAPAPAARPTVDLSTAEQVYVVQSGDSLSRIASRYGTTVARLREANALTGDRILVGQKLAIPSGSRPTAVAASAPAPTPVTVRQPTTPPEEKPAPSAEPERPTASVIRPAPTVPAASEPGDDAIAGFSAQPITYTVLEGDTIDIIAKLFIVSKQDILTLNNLEPDAVLEKGQRIQIPPSAL